MESPGIPGLFPFENPGALSSPQIVRMGSSYVSDLPMEVGSFERISWENAVIANKRMASVLGILVLGALAWGCSGSGTGDVLYVDAEFDPATPSDTSIGISEANLGVAQTFTVLASGKFEQFWFVITDGESPDDGVIQVTVRPVVAGVPNANPASSIITAININTATLPATLVEQFTMFDVGNDPGREVMMGEEYAIVVEFVSRAGVDTTPIARVLGQVGDPYAGGTGAVDAGTGYVANTDDYLFRTFSLR